MPRLTNKPRKRKDGRFEVRLTVKENGRSRRISVFGKTAKEAEAKAREIKSRIEQGTYSRDRTTLSGYAQAWLERKAREVRPRTVQLYRLELAYALPSLKDPHAPDPLGSRKLQEVKPAHIREVLDALAERYSIRTVRMVRQRLHQVFEDALRMELIFRNPVHPVQVKAPRGEAAPRVGRALEPHEIAALLAALDRHKDPRTALALRLMLACGLRRGECLGLQWGDLDLEAGVLTVRRAWTDDGSTGKVSPPKTPTSGRTLPIPHATLERLKAYRLWYTDCFGEPRPDSWLFPGNGADKPLNPHAPNWALKRIAERLGLGALRVHDLRHSYGSHLLASGAPLELVAERMGHANPNITLGVYRHLLAHERRGWLLDPEDLIGPRPQA